MDPQLQAKIDEARANGYTEEEINAYIANQGQPLAQNPPIDRSEEYLGLAQGLGSKALEYGIGGYGLYKAGQGIARAFGGPAAPTGPAVPTVAPAGSPQATMDILKSSNPQQTAQMARQAAPQPSIMQRGMDIASQMRQAAAQRVVPMVAPTAVPAAVGMGGAAATGMAANQMAAMTPEQRRRFYENSMLGAMGGDAGLAAAIMNRGQ